jgi:hypothetical protein
MRVRRIDSEIQKRASREIDPSGSPDAWLVVGRCPRSRLLARNNFRLARDSGVIGNKAIFAHRVANLLLALRLPAIQSRSEGRWHGYGLRDQRP